MDESNKSDAELVRLVLDPRSPATERNQAATELSRRCLQPLGRILCSQVARKKNFYGACGLDLEDLVVESFFKAIHAFDPKQGSLLPLLCTIALNQVSDLFRAKKRRPAKFSPDEKQFEEPPTHDALGPAAQAILGEVLQHVKACLRAITSPDRRRAVVWCSLLQIPPRDLVDIWPNKTHQAIRALHSRGLEDLYRCWFAGPGARLADLADELMGRVQEMVDPGRIKDTKQREAYRAWIATGDVPTAAARLGVPEARLREQVLDALEDLMHLATERKTGKARPIDLGALPADGTLSEYLELGRERLPQYASVPEEQRRVCDVLNRHLLIMRIALGLANPHEGRETLGALVHAAVAADGPNAYSRWCRDLGMTRAAFTRLLGDDLEPSPELLRRLARRIRRPLGELRRCIVVRSETKGHYRRSREPGTAARIHAKLLARLAQEDGR